MATYTSFFESLLTETLEQHPFSSTSAQQLRDRLIKGDMTFELELANAAAHSPDCAVSDLKTFSDALTEHKISAGAASSMSESQSK
eukprot:6467212-Amphidinium_carterae.1